MSGAQRGRQTWRSINRNMLTSSLKKGKDDNRQAVQSESMTLSLQCASAEEFEITTYISISTVSDYQILRQIGIYYRFFAFKINTHTHTSFVWHVFLFLRDLKVGVGGLLKLMTVKHNECLKQHSEMLKICWKATPVSGHGGTIWGKNEGAIYFLVSPIKSQFSHEWWVSVSTQLATVANLSHFLWRFICCRLAEWCMSTFETLNPRGVVIICVITHRGNGLRKPLVLKVCREISGWQTSALSARLIENQCRLGVTIHEVSTCLGQLFPA